MCLAVQYLAGVDSALVLLSRRATEGQATNKHTHEHSPPPMAAPPKPASWAAMEGQAGDKHSHEPSLMTAAPSRARGRVLCLAAGATPSW